ncbi:MAG: type II toxin-antitoxin system VapC family toxin [Candidatus Electrothrix sp. GW3-4]|uniref:type II toxin-antitoxin system VapC family toxin n=1 Tax=Candidatus Electrothrix sp. GW3-4 TaxID=3126740 RepID=UPI0030CF3782
MKPIVYVESSVISYLTSRPSRDVVIAGRQAVTVEWWDTQRHRFEMRISILVEEEISRGDVAAAELRKSRVADIPSLSISDEAVWVANLLLEEKAVPLGSEDDALHIGIAAAQGSDYLLTWNFKHINNAEKKAAITRLVESCGYACPLFCSLEELGGETDD